MRAYWCRCTLCNSPTPLPPPSIRGPFPHFSAEFQMWYSMLPQAADSVVNRKISTEACNDSLCFCFCFWTHARLALFSFAKLFVSCGSFQGPSLLKGAKDDGPTVHAVFHFCLRQETAQALSNLESAQPSVRLVAAYFRYSERTGCCVFLCFALLCRRSSRAVLSSACFFLHALSWSSYFVRSLVWCGLSNWGSALDIDEDCFK